MTAVAYFGDEKLKRKYVSRAKRHRKADDLIQSYGYWREDENGRMKGCAIGCLAHAENYAHEALETQTGLPVRLSRLADAIFEELPDPDFKSWPERYAAAAKPGADLSKVHHQFCAWLLVDFFVESLKPETWAEVEPVCTRVAALHRRAAAGEVVTSEEWAAAWAAARDAASNAASDAAWDAASDAAWDAASDAASDAAWDAASNAACDAARAAACDAARDAARAAACDAARDAARAAAWKKMADKLVELMSAA